jgi:hypothetical protein
VQTYNSACVALFLNGASSRRADETQQPQLTAALCCFEPLTFGVSCFRDDKDSVVGLQLKFIRLHDLLRIHYNLCAKFFVQRYQQLQL